MELVSRQMALTLGLPRYFTGKPCKHGHVSERHTQLRVCFTCRNATAARIYAKRARTDLEFVARRKETTQTWRKKNPDKLAAHNLKWRLKNPDKHRASRLRWLERNLEKQKAYLKNYRTQNAEAVKVGIKRWIENNPEKTLDCRRASLHNRRAREANGGHVSSRDMAKLRLLQKGRCAACLKKTKLSVDHIMPLARGGTGHRSNLQLLCMPCNQSKGSRDPIEWSQSRGALI